MIVSKRGANTQLIFKVGQLKSIPTFIDTNLKILENHICHRIIETFAK